MRGIIESHKLNIDQWETIREASDRLGILSDVADYAGTTSPSVFAVVILAYSAPDSRSVNYGAACVWQGHVSFIASSRDLITLRTWTYENWLNVTDLTDQHGAAAHPLAFDWSFIESSLDDPSESESDRDCREFLSLLGNI
jgi:hypothetical protein